MKTNAEQAIAAVDRQKMIVEKSTKLLTELNPAFKEKQENEQRLTNIESSISEMKETFAGFMEELKS